MPTTPHLTNFKFSLCPEVFLLSSLQRRSASHAAQLTRNQLQPNQKHAFLPLASGIHLALRSKAKISRCLRPVYGLDSL